MRSKRPWLVGCALALAAAGALAPPFAHGQAGGATQLNDRNGPEAPPPTPPSFARPPASDLFPKASVPEHAAPPPGAAATLLIKRVVVTPDQKRPAARAKHAQVAPPAGVLGLSARRGEWLNARWIERQFCRNQMIGQPTSAERVVTLVLMINHYFLANGYINSGVLLGGPPDPSPDGVLHLSLVNGRLIPAGGSGAAAQVNWAQGRRGGLTEGYILDRLPATGGVPLDGAALEQQFRRLAEDPAIRTIKASLTPNGPPGEAALSLTVDPQPRLDSYVSFANSRSPAIGGERVAVGGSGRSAFLAGDVLGLEFGETAGAQDSALSYSAPVTPRSDVEFHLLDDRAGVVTQGLRNLDIRSREMSQEFGVSHKLIDQPLTPIGETGRWAPAQSLTLGAIFVQRESTSSLLGQPFSFSPGAVAGRSDYSVGRVTANWQLRDETQVAALSSTYTFGLHGSGSDVPGVGRPKSNFKTVLTQASYARRLNKGSLVVQLRLTDQIASGLIYTGDQFSIGGANTVRGFRENLLLGDSGAAGSVELACSVRPGLWPCDKTVNDWKTLRVSVFVDGGYVHSFTAQQPSPDAIGSTGVSLLWTPIDSFTARFTYGRPFKYVRPVGAANIQDQGVSFEVALHPFSAARALFPHHPS